MGRRLLAFFLSIVTFLIGYNSTSEVLRRLLIGLGGTLLVYSLVSGVIWGILVFTGKNDCEGTKGWNMVIDIFSVIVGLVVSLKCIDLFMRLFDSMIEVIRSLP